MPELSRKCTSTPVPAPPPTPPSAPTIPPEREPAGPAPPPVQADEPPPGGHAPDAPAGFNWEDHAVFRFTFLRYFTVPEVAAALRVLGVLAYDLVLECWGSWPPGADESLMVSELRASAADLRFLQAFLADQSEARTAMDLKSYLNSKRQQLEERLAEVEALRTEIATLEDEMATLDKALAIAQRDGVELGASGTLWPPKTRPVRRSRRGERKKPVNVTLADAIRLAVRALPAPFTTADVRGRIDRSLYRNRTSLAATMRRMSAKGELKLVASGGPGREATYSLPPTNRELFDDSEKGAQRG